MIRQIYLVSKTEVAINAPKRSLVDLCTFQDVWDDGVLARTTHGPLVLLRVLKPLVADGARLRVILTLPSLRLHVGVLADTSFVRSASDQKVAKQTSHG